MNIKYKLKKYYYKCACGHEVDIFLDFKIYNNSFVCSNCGAKIKLNDVNNDQNTQDKG